ncbi:MAG: nucleoside-diphosphate-sugar epimerase [Candidatus Angelobacter sp. Gp1-AA117]|nr:MAG: nucleoside-diphosphate-sugar epimerase [Candidatus Angelobacter sp. Gp1-AA117]
MSKNILVTGGAGFIGSHLVDALLAEGHNVRVFDNLTLQVHPEGKIPEYLAKDAELVIGDMRDERAVKMVLDGMDVVYHLAAVVGVGQSMYEIAHYMGVNTQGTAILLQELLNRRNHVEKLIVASSMSIYGEGKYLCAQCGEVSPPLRSNEQLKAKQWEVNCPACGEVLTPIATDESKPLQCPSYYALSKKDQEEMCLLYGRTYGLPVVALRYFNIYGSRQALSNPYTGVCAIFASRILNGNPPLVFEDGRQMREFVSVADITQANLLAMERSEADGMALNISSGEPISISEVSAGLAEALDSQIPAQLTGRYRAGDVRHCFPDISRARKYLGYKPKVRFLEGMKDLAQWLRSQQPQDRMAEAVAQLSSLGLTA